MTLLLAALLALLPAAAPAPPPLGVVLVTVDGGPAWTPATEAAALADVDAALAWLRARGLAAPGGAEAPRHLAAPRIDTWEWLRGEWPGRLTLYLVNNDGAPHLTLGGTNAGAYLHPHRALALTDTPLARQALIAHELAHALTDLPDWPAPCGVLDILCDPGPAYAAGTLGCLTLAALGTPCQRLYLPEVGL